MRHSDLSFLPPDPARVDEVIQDVELLDAGVVVHYVVDPFEIQTFCFPAQQADSQSWSWHEAMNHIVALYEVFYGCPQRPILLDEYNYELAATIRHYRHEAEKGLDGTGRPLKEADSNNSADPVDDFIATLAVAMGVFNESLSRLKNLLADRLLSTQNIDLSGDVALKRLFQNNRTSPDYAIDVAVETYRAILEDYQQKSKRSMSFRKREQVRNSILVDSQAFCRLVRIQTAALDTQRNGGGDKHLFYYVSSAERTAFLLRTVQDHGKLPNINGHPFTMWRTTRQILLRLLCADPDIAVTKRRLSRMKDLSEIFKSFGGILPDYHNLPEDVQLQIQAYRTSIEQHYNSIQRFGLASLLSTSRQFYEMLSEPSETDRMRKARLEIRRRVAAPDWARKASRLVSLNLFFAEAKSTLADSLIFNLASRPYGLNEHHATRSGRDPVASSKHHFPTVFLVQFEGYSEIIDDIKLYFETPVHGGFGREAIIARAAAAFLERDKTISELGADQVGHEFVRNLFILALPPTDADRFACDHAEEMLTRIRDLLDCSESTEVRAKLEGLKREFYYIACWAARRQADYKKGERLSTDAIDMYSDQPCDPRFFHARCLNTYAWFEDFHSSLGGKPARGASIERAVSDALKAIEGYKPLEERAPGQVGVLYNTIACLYVYRLDDLYDVQLARRYLDLLKETTDKGTWLGRFPEYFHTEALVEFEEFRYLVTVNSDIGQQLSKLQNARREIEFAYSMYHKSPNAALKHRDKVEVLRSQILDAIDDCQRALRPDSKPEDLP